MPLSLTRKINGEIIVRVPPSEVEREVRLLVKAVRGKQVTLCVMADRDIEIVRSEIDGKYKIQKEKYDGSST